MFAWQRNAQRMEFHKAGDKNSEVTTNSSDLTKLERGICRIGHLIKIYSNLKSVYMKNAKILCTKKIKYSN